MELQSRLNDIRARGLGLAAVSYDSPDILAAFSRRHGITFPLLSDAGSTAIKAYGLLNPIPGEVLGPSGDDPALVGDISKYVSFGRQPQDAGGVIMRLGMVGVAFPGTFIVDRRGRVTARFFEEFYAERSTASSIMLRLGGGAVPVEATKISTDYLDIVAHSTDSVVAPGNRFALVVTVTPQPGVHVYAPGASGYRSAQLTVAPEPSVRLAPLQYPASEIYFFKPLNERVPVYQKPFTLVQDVVVSTTTLQTERALVEKKELTLNGRFDYQACDDKICFMPGSAALTWRLTLKPNVSDRPTRRGEGRAMRAPTERARRGQPSHFQLPG